MIPPTALSQEGPIPRKNESELAHRRSLKAQYGLLPDSEGLDGALSVGSMGAATKDRPDGSKTSYDTFTI